MDDSIGKLAEMQWEIHADVINGRVTIRNGDEELLEVVIKEPLPIRLGYAELIVNKLRGKRGG